MEYTEAGHTESTIRNAQNVPTNPSSDVETFCMASLKLLQSTEAITVRLHDNLLRFKECGKQCGFCRYLYGSFDDELVQEITTRYKTDVGLCVDAGIKDLHMSEKNRLVDKVRLWVAIREDIGWRGKGLAERSFIMLSNGGM
jgi:hypothetical protein